MPQTPDGIRDDWRLGFPVGSKWVKGAAIDAKECRGLSVLDEYGVSWDAVLDFYFDVLL